MQVKIKSPFAALFAALVLSTGSLAYVGATSAFAQDTGGVGLSEGALLEYERKHHRRFRGVQPERGGGERHRGGRAGDPGRL